MFGVPPLGHPRPQSRSPLGHTILGLVLGVLWKPPPCWGAANIHQGLKECYF